MENQTPEPKAAKTKVAAEKAVEPKAKNPNIPDGVHAQPGDHVFISRQKEVTFFQFEGARPILLGDGRLAWVHRDPEKVERLKGHHHVKVQRIHYVGEA